MTDGRAWGASRWLRFSDDPDPRQVQSIFALLMTADLAMRLAGTEELRRGSWQAAAIALTAAVWVAALVVPWSRLPRYLVGLLPVLDVAALGMSRLNSEGSGAGILVILPAVWLAWQFGARGALVVGLSTVLLMAVPSLVYVDAGGMVVSRALLLPIVTTWVAFALASSLGEVRAVRDQARQRGAQLAAALATIEDQRRFSDAVLNTVDVGLVLLDRDGAYRTMNRRHEDFMRLAYPDGHAGRAGQLGHVYAEDGVTPLTREEMPTRRASLGEEFDDVRLWIGGDRLTNRAVSVSARSVRDEHGAFAGAALAYTDVTDYMRALQIKDEFVASVSHELRTPLTSILGYVDILQDRDDLPEVVGKQLGVMSRNTQRLQRLVADLLHTAQADGAPMHVTRTPTDLARIARDAVEAATPSAEAADIVIEVELPDSLEVMVDAQRMAQVVDNLISNAIKYSSAGGRIRVSLSLDVDRVELAVADTGIGIEAADRDRLFTRFFRARDVQETTIQGVGLGLSIARTIVESHGGRIEVDSEVGKGSVFRVRLPHLPR